MTVGYKRPTVADIMASTLDKNITIPANDCGYGGTEKELIVNYVHPFFLKTKSAGSREDNPNCRKVTTGVFAETIGNQ